MGLFGGGNDKPTRLNGVQFTQSVQGLPLPIVMGRGKVQQSLLWMDGFKAKKVQQGGKGGGKGGSAYVYSANVVVGLTGCQITGVNDVWAGQNWLSNSSTIENYTIAGSGVYTPLNSSVFVLDSGAGVLSNYSGSYTDVGAPSPTVLNGTSYAPMRQVPYGTTLTSGTYSINPADGTYHFDVAHDVGRTVQVSYSFRLTQIRQQENVLISTGRTTSVGGTLKFSQDLGVRYLGGANSNTALIRDSGSGFPTTTGHYTVSGSGPATYKFATGDIASEVQISFQIENLTAVGQDQPKLLNFSIQNGAKGQAVWPTLAASFPSQALGYSNTSLACYAPMDLGMGANVQDVTYEVTTADAYGGGIKDCNPIRCITQVLTNSVWGLGAGVTPFPTYIMDNGPLGTWGGAPGTPGAHTVSNTAWSWFAANGFFISPVIDSQDTASELISKWLEAGMCSAFMSEGLFKIVPYGDTSTVANGQTWVAPANFVVALDDSCFLGETGKDPVKISRAAWQDGYNSVQVNYDNVGNQYAPELIQESDQASIDRYGLRLEDAQSWGFIKTLPAAQFAASMRVKRSVNVRNTYTFKLPFSYSYLEPMDVCTITTSSIWAQGVNNANLKINTLPVRIQKIVDDPIDGLEITAEDYPWGTHQPVIFNKEISSANVVSNAYATPGASEVVMFEATPRLSKFSGGQLWIGASGQSDDWGGCNIWVSHDGDKYLQVGTIETPARLGELDITFDSGGLSTTDLLTNGSFESGLTGWNLYNNAGSGFITLALDGTTAYTGTQSAKITWTSQPTATMGVYHPAAFVANKTYTLAFYAKATANGLGLTPELRWNIAPAAVQWVNRPALSADWQLYTALIFWGATVDDILYVDFANAGTATTPSGTLNVDVFSVVEGLPADPDAAHSLVVDLVTNSDALDAGTTADADLGTTLCFVDGEIISYSACSVSGTDQYTMNTYIRRGQMGTAVGTHVAGSLFMRLDDAVFQYNYDPSWIGKTLYFKFQSFNAFQNNPEPLESLTPTSFVLSGSGQGTVDASSGLVLGVTNQFNVGAGALGWTPAATT